MSSIAAPQAPALPQAGLRSRSPHGWAATVLGQTLLDALDGIAYLTDAEGVIQAVGRSRWNTFAQESGWSSGGSDTIVGQRLFDSIAGSEVRQTAMRLHEVVATGRQTGIYYHYRCDAPCEKRHMRMAITCVECSDEPMVLYQSQVLSVTQRPPLHLFDYGALARKRAAERLPLVTLCSYCHSVAWPHGSTEREWIEPEEYYVRGGSGDVSVSHGICPACFETLMDEVE